jgi:hypothetical protein
MKEPLPLNIKRDRAGLGLNEGIKRKVVKEAKRQKVMRENLEENFRQRQRHQFERKRTDGYWKNALSICLQLDLEKKLWNSPYLRTYMPSELPDETKSEDTEEHSTMANPKKEDKQLDISEAISLSKDEIQNGQGQSEEFDEKRLLGIIDYLRTTHFYCIFCGCGYGTEEGLANCPGPTEANHEQ